MHCIVVSTYILPALRAMWNFKYQLQINILSIFILCLIGRDLSLALWDILLSCIATISIINNFHYMVLPNIEFSHQIAVFLFQNNFFSTDFRSFLYPHHNNSKVFYFREPVTLIGMKISKSKAIDQYAGKFEELSHVAWLMINWLKFDTLPIFYLNVYEYVCRCMML